MMPHDNTVPVDARTACAGYYHPPTGWALAYSHTDDDADYEVPAAHRSNAVVGAVLAVSIAAVTLAVSLAVTKTRHPDESVPATSTTTTIEEPAPTTTTVVTTTVAPAPDGPAARRARFFSLMRADDIRVTDANTAVHSAETICDRLAGATSQQQVVDQMTAEGYQPVWSLPDIVAAANAVYCPQYAQGQTG
jgi:hypothetical protein